MLKMMETRLLEATRKEMGAKVELILTQMASMQVCVRRNPTRTRVCICKRCASKPACCPCLISLLLLAES